MLTTCPECHTTFRVAHDQLETRRGLVRCGYCRAVFNAYDTLLPEFESPASAETNENPVSGLPIETPPAAPAPVTERPFEHLAQPVPPEPRAAPAFEPWPEFEPLPEPEPFLEPEPAAEAGRRPLLESLPEPTSVDDPFLEVGGEIPRLTLYDEVARQGEPMQTEAAAPEALSLPPLLETPDAILLSELPTRARIEPKPQTWKTALLGLLSVLLALGLVAQAAYFFRAAIVQGQPALRSVFEQVCRDLGCEVPLSRQLDLLKVESSSLETDPEQPTRAKLKVDFSNRAQQAQAWPCFVLRLSDVQGGPLAQRVFWPKDYLPQGKDLKAGMAPMSEQEFKLDLDLGGLSASGYEIKPKYP